jgi:hypothetical protein
MRARPLFVIEITSPTTRKKDLTDKSKLFYTVGVPMYVLVDLDYGGGRNPHGIIAFQAGPTEYEPLPPESNGRVWLEVVDVFLGAEHGRVVCYDREGIRIPDPQELRRQLTTEKQRADAAEQRLAELEAELKRIRGDTK